MRRTISKLLGDNFLIALSDYIYKSLPESKTLKASLARVSPSVIPQKPFEIEESEKNYILIIGRGKRYQAMRQSVRLIASMSEEKIITTCRSKSNFVEFSNVVTINRWLKDEEMEYLISKSGVLICLYDEASQSGIVEQAKYWGVPIIVSDTGALPEQIQGRANCHINMNRHELQLKEQIEAALSQQNLSKNWNRNVTLREALEASEPNFS
jgi:glycosyltransferase involved in cell wall biosynthesis